MEQITQRDCGITIIGGFKEQLKQIPVRNRPSVLGPASVQEDRLNDFSRSLPVLFFYGSIISLKSIELCHVTLLEDIAKKRLTHLLSITCLMSFNGWLIIATFLRIPSYLSTIKSNSPKPCWFVYWIRLLHFL